jgi:hypothetical protein
MKPDRKKKRLSLEETAALLGAEAPKPIGNVRLDPISMRAVATRIGKRLASSGGRPTDSSWEISRKVPMKAVTWERLRDLAKSLAEQNVRVAPGQLAAIALERGLFVLIRECRDSGQISEAPEAYGSPHPDVDPQTHRQDD